MMKRLISLTFPRSETRCELINSSFAGSGKSDHVPPALTEPWREWLPEQHEVFFENAGETMIDCGLATKAELLAGPGSSGGGGTGNGAGTRGRRAAA